MASQLNIQDRIRNYSKSHKRGAVPAAPSLTEEDPFELEDVDPDDPERRISDRVRISMAVKQQVESRVFVCQASNLSYGGMFLARVFERCYEQAPKCMVEFGLPGGAEDEHLAVPARIVRQTRRGRYHLMALRFSSLSPSHRRMLGEFLHVVRSPQELLAFETAAW